MKRLSHAAPAAICAIVVGQFLAASNGGPAEAGPRYQVGGGIYGLYQPGHYPGVVVVPQYYYPANPYPYHRARPLVVVPQPLPETVYVYPEPVYPRPIYRQPVYPHPAYRDRSYYGERERYDPRDAIGRDPRPSRPRFAALPKHDVAIPVPRPGREDAARELPRIDVPRDRPANQAPALDGAGAVDEWAKPYLKGGAQEANPVEKSAPVPQRDSLAPAEPKSSIEPSGEPGRNPAARADRGETLAMWTPQWVARCKRLYPDFDDRSGTYVGKDGKRRICKFD
jgi:hypothetical protein